MNGGLDRRDVLRFGGLASLAAFVAGCAGKTSDSGTRPPLPSPSGETRGLPTASPSPSVRSPSPSPSPGPAKPTYAQLAKQMSGSLSRPGGRGYDPRALLYNPRFAGQTSPQAIAHCASTADVAACVRFAADDGAPLRIRNGGH